MRYVSPDSDYEHFVDLGEFESKDWEQVVDLYAMVRPVQYSRGSHHQYVSIAARFSDDPSQYHSVPVYMNVKKGVVDVMPLHEPQLKGPDAIDGVRVAIERLLAKNILGKRDAD